MDVKKRRRRTPKEVMVKEVLERKMDHHVGFSHITPPIAGSLFRG